MTLTDLNPRKKQLLVKKNIIVRFDLINSVNKAGQSNKNNDTYPTSFSILDNNLKIMKFIKPFIYIVVFFLSANICYCQDMAIITGKSIGLKENDKIIIYSSPGSYLDSAFVKNSVFKFEIPIKTAALFFLRSPTEAKLFKAPVFIKPNSKINMKVDKTLSDPEFSGDKLALDQNNFWQGINPISARIEITQKKIADTKDSLTLIKLNTELNKEVQKINDYAKTWVKQHRSSPFGPSVILLFIHNTNPSAINSEDAIAEKYFEYLLPEAKENNEGANTLEKLFSTYNGKYTNNLSLDEINSGEARYLDDKKYSKIPLGSIAPDFTVKDTSGRLINLSDFKNQYLLIDFWASWCGPCRRNDPSLKKLYNQYKANGLHVLSVSTDEDAEKWRKAIREDKMNWTQGSDLIGANSVPAMQYGVKAIPVYILLDPTGEIILKSEGDIDFVEEKIKGILSAAPKIQN